MISASKIQLWAKPPHPQIKCQTLTLYAKLLHRMYVSYHIISKGCWRVHSESSHCIPARCI